MKPGRILIIEDESAIADALQFAFERDGFSVSRAATGGSGIQSILREAPLLTVLDVGLPDMSGFDVCREVRKFSASPILFLTARAEEVDRVLGLELGADDYVTKPFSSREVVARVKAILRRGQPVAAPASKNSRFRVDAERCSILFDDKALELSRYEYRLLATLVNRPGKVFSRDELMSRAWECPEMSLERTIDTHIKTIRSKLRVLDPKDDSIITHRGMGYSLRENE